MDKNMTQSDRRKHTRVAIETEYHLFLNDGEYSGTTGNISLSGAFLSKPEPELMPSCVSQSGLLKITLNGEPLSFKCEIVYVATHDNDILPAGAGVVFCDTDDETVTSQLNLAISQKPSIS
ncbi:MAG: PilZ domain-containing protein [Methylovulum sp.]|nr:MAG: PilZ domain-containing protein [Methylovulum sp.]